MALMLKVYKQNLLPLLKFLEHAYQGVWTLGQGEGQQQQSYKHCNHYHPHWGLAAGGDGQEGHVHDHLFLVEAQA